MPTLRELRERISRASARDFPRLYALWKALPQNAPDDPRWAALLRQIEQSEAVVAARAASTPALSIPDELPIAAHAAALIDAIEKHPVLIVAGATGSGKTTQLPKLALMAGRGIRGQIGCTQPRRIAARSIARRVAEETGTALGAEVGFAVRFQDQVSDRTLIKFMTDGILLAETQSDKQLRRYDTLIIDEAHERSLNIDFLLGYAKNLLSRRPDLKLIITSATIDTERFARHFAGAPVIEIEGRGYPVEVRYRPVEGDRDERTDTGLVRAISAAIDELGAEDPRGDFLVFLPGEREIRDVHKALEARRLPHTEILPLYARLSHAAQDRVFKPGTGRRVVLATNVAETSITVPRIRFVIDTGLARINRYSQRAKVQRLQIEAISQAAANQRAGRCGRTSAGICVRLYDEADFAKRRPYTDPELLRSSLAGVILRMLDLGLGDPKRFPFIDAPSDRAIDDGFLLLHELGALDDKRSLTAIGRDMARLPIDVRLARFLIAARETRQLAVALVLAAALSIQDPRERPAEARGLADAAHRIDQHDKSDLLTLVNLWLRYSHEHEERTQSQLREWCKSQFLSYLRMREWRELHRQLKLLANEAGWLDDGTVEIDALLAAASDARAYEALHKAFLAAYVTHVARKDEKQRYRGPRGRSLQIFPGSGQAKQNPPWIVSATILETEKLYGLCNARIDPHWIEPLCQHLSKRQHYDPVWDPKAGRAVGYEDVTLYGLPIVQRRRINYASADPPAARALLIRHQLVRGEGPARHPVLAHNDALREQAKDKEEKLRRRGLLRDELALCEWFDTRVPLDVLDAHQLQRWLKNAPAEASTALKLSLDDLVIPEARFDERELFPDALELAGERLPVRYVFDPKGDRDGATLNIPLRTLMGLSQSDIDWLVPGWREEKAAALIKSLPKALRKHVVPAPDFARAFLAATPPRQAPFAVALADFLTRVSGAAIDAADFDDAEIAPHLHLNLQVLGDDGEPLDRDRSLALLKERYAQAARDAFAARIDKVYWADGLDDWPTIDLPESIADAGVRAYPALVDQGERVGIRAFADPAEAQAAHAAGVLALLRQRTLDVQRYWQRHLSLSNEARLAYGVLAPVDALRSDIVSAALAELAADRGSVRNATSFAALVERIRKSLGERVQARTALIDDILVKAKQARAALTPLLMGHAAANLADARDHLAGLIAPGFAASVPLERLAHFPRYLQALILRIERLKREPSKDQAKLLDVLPFQREQKALGNDELRWLLEEFRVSLFAQELGTAEAVSAKRVAKRIAELKASA
jgi:ATP-dependent helicase HrpA